MFLYRSGCAPLIAETSLCRGLVSCFNPSGSALGSFNTQVTREVCDRGQEGPNVKALLGAPIAPVFFFAPLNVYRMDFEG